MSVSIDCKELINKFVEQNSDVPEIQFMIKEKDTIVIKEVEGCGVINWIFRVQSQDGLHSVILKHGVGFARHNTELKFTLERQVIEYSALKLMDRIMPGSVPQPYCYDSKNNIICMEDLQGMNLLGNDLRNGEINIETAANIGRIVAQMHIATSKQQLTEQEWLELKTSFANRENAEKMHIIQYSTIFQEDDPIVALPEIAVPVFRKNVSLLLSNQIDKRLKELMEVQEFFIHGDCHWMCVFRKGDRIALFDFEWAHLGNPIYQLGWIATAYYVCLMESTTKNPSRGKEIKDLTEEAFKTIVDSYQKWRDNSAPGGRSDIDFSALALICGCNTFFNAVLVGGEQLISLTDEKRCHLINIGSKMMLQSENVTCLDDVTKLLFHSDEAMTP